MKNCLSKTKFDGAQKDLRILATKAPPWLRDWGKALKL